MRSDELRPRPDVRAVDDKAARNPQLSKQRELVIASLTRCPERPNKTARP
jgi:hypothetical protein